MFNFMKISWLYFLISALVIIPGLISLAMFGLKVSMDFTGGSLLEFSTSSQNLEVDSVTDVVKDLIPEARVLQVGVQEFQIKGQSINNETKNKVLTSLEASFAGVNEVRFETLGPAIGQELLFKTGVAILLSFIMILLYLARQFRQLKYGFFAILAMIHDSVVLIGSFSLLGYFMNVEVDVLFVTALLTALSFSVHDTIVVYDRIRELQKTHPHESDGQVINAAIWQTINRSLNNSMTVIVMLLALVVLGGATIKWFAVALLIGAITGTYSSTFVAVPLLYHWEKVSPKLGKLFKSKLKFNSKKTTF